MLQVGSQVVYGIHGVCRIVDAEIRRVDRKKVEYFVLEPVDQPGTRYYVPTQNQVALSKLRSLLSKDELEALLISEDARKDIWISDENQRKQKYREIINNGDRASLLCMIRCLQQHRENQLAAGRKFHLSDENFLRDAKKILSSEFSLVLGIPQAEVGAYIESKL